MTNKLGAIRWLHLSDFHQGAESQGQSWLWPTVKSSFLADLADMHKKVGSIDLVLFTGDLTQSADPQQFREFTQTLDEIFKHLRSLGSDPVLLVVPGNHDLVWPKLNPAVRLLLEWTKQPQVQDEFWSSADNEYLGTVNNAFSNYKNWLKEWNQKQGASASIQLNDGGLIAGDFGVTIERNGIRLYVAGLNSAFLQLDRGYFLERLEVHPKQLQAVCKPDWEKEHDAALLLTHHPPSWLHRDALKNYRSGIANPELFASHLFGHMHEPDYSEVAEGGAPSRATFQAASLFSAERFGTSNDRTRIHGYGIGELHFPGNGAEGVIKTWVRRSVQKSSGVWKFDHEVKFERAEDGSIDRPRHFKRLRAMKSNSVLGHPAVGLPNVPPSQPAPPPSFDPFYVHRQRLEQPVLAYLHQPARTPIVLRGPAYIGKKTLLRAVLDEWRRDEALLGRSPSIVWIDFSDLPRGNAADLLGLLKGIALEVGSSILEDEQAARDRFAIRWSDGGHTGSLTTFVRRDILPKVGSTLLLVFKNADQMRDSPLNDAFWSMLQGWMDSIQTEAIERQTSVWQKLRFITLVKTSQPDDGTIFGSSYFGHADLRNIDEFTYEEVQELVKRHPWPAQPTEAQIRHLMTLVGGHPALLRRILAAATDATGSLSLNLALLRPVCQKILDPILSPLKKTPDLLAALQLLVGQRGQPIKAEQASRLQLMGLIQGDSVGGYRIRYQLLESYLSTRNNG